MEKLEIGKLPEILEIHYELKEPLLILGPPGIGKSESVIEFAKKKAKDLKRKYVNWFDLSEDQIKEVLENPDKYFVLVDIRLYEYDPTEIKGLLYIDDKNNISKLYPWDWMVLFHEKNSAGIIFLDELNMAHPDIMKIAFKIINDKILGNRRIQGHVLIIAAGNPSNYNYLVNELPLPLVDRMSIYYVDTNVYDWLKWAISNNVNEKVIKFITIYPQFLFYSNQIREYYTHKILTPRTWYKISKMIDTLEKKYENKTKLIEHLERVLVGYFHPEVFRKFISFYKIQTISPKSSISVKDPERFSEIANNIEEVIIYIDSVAGQFVYGNLSLEDIKKILRVVMKEQFEYAIYLVISIYNLLKRNLEKEEMKRKLDDFSNMIRFDFPDIFVTIANIALE